MQEAQNSICKRYQGLLRVLAGVSILMPLKHDSTPGKFERVRIWSVSISDDIVLQDNI